MLCRTPPAGIDTAQEVVLQSGVTAFEHAGMVSARHRLAHRRGSRATDRTTGATGSSPPGQATKQLLLTGWKSGYN